MFFYDNELTLLSYKANKMSTSCLFVTEEGTINIASDMFEETPFLPWIYETATHGIALSYSTVR